VFGRNSIVQELQAYRMVLNLNDSIISVDPFVALSGG